MRLVVACVSAAAVWLTLCAAGRGQSQPVDKAKLMNKNPLSPPKETSVIISGKQLWIVYHAPSVHRRKVFGGAWVLQPDGSIWRLGADYATVLHTGAPLEFEGLSVPAGEYSLYVALDKGKWQLIVNKQTGQWGIKEGGVTSDNPKLDLGRVRLAMSKPPELVEQLKIELTGAGGDQGKLDIAWEHTEASAPFTVR